MISQRSTMALQFYHSIWENDQKWGFLCSNVIFSRPIVIQSDKSVGKCIRETVFNSPIWILHDAMLQFELLIGRCITKFRNLISRLLDGLKNVDFSIPMKNRRKFCEKKSHECKTKFSHENQKSYEKCIYLHIIVSTIL